MFWLQTAFLRSLSCVSHGGQGKDAGSAMRGSLSQYA